MRRFDVRARSCSWLPVRAHARLELVDHLSDLLPLGQGLGLVLGRGALCSQALLLGLAFATPDGILLPLFALGRYTGAELGYKAAGGGAGDEPAQVGHGAEANTANLKAAREFIEQALGLITAPAQQQTCGLAFVRQHLLGKDQFTTTRQRVRRTRRRGGVLWLLY